MDNYLILLMFFTCFILCVFFSVLGRKDWNWGWVKKIWWVLWFIFLLIASGICVPISAMFLSEDFLSETRHFTSGHMNGSQGVFWLGLIVVGLFSQFIAGKITNTPPYGN